MAKPSNINMAPGGGGGRTSGGITGPGGKSVTPIYKQSIPPASVKKMVPSSQSARDFTNYKETIRVQNAKAGKGAHQGEMDAFEKALPKLTIKINSNK